MAISLWSKVFKQLDNKPAKKKKFIKHNSPLERKYGRIVKSCRTCGSRRGLIKKYNLLLCRRCFRENAKEIGFKKYN